MGRGSGEGGPIYELRLHAEGDAPPGACAGGADDGGPSLGAGCGRAVGAAAEGSGGDGGFSLTPCGREVVYFGGGGAPAVVARSGEGDRFVDLHVGGGHGLVGTAEGALVLLEMPGGHQVWSAEIAELLPYETVVSFLALPSRQSSGGSAPGPRIALLTVEGSLHIIEATPEGPTQRSKVNLRLQHAGLRGLGWCSRRSLIAVLGSGKKGLAAISLWKLSEDGEGAIVRNVTRASSTESSKLELGLNAALGFDLKRILTISDTPRFVPDGSQVVFSHLGEELAVLNSSGSLELFSVHDKGEYKFLVERRGEAPLSGLTGVAWWGEKELATTTDNGTVHILKVPEMHDILADAPEKFNLLHLQLCSPKPGRLFILGQTPGHLSPGDARLAETWQLLSMNQRTALEMMQLHVDEGDYSAALKLAQASGLDTDLIYKARWAEEEACAATIQEILGKVRDRSWVIDECCSCVASTAEGQYALLDYAIEEMNKYRPQGADGSGEIPPPFSSEQLWHFKRRLRLLNYRDKLDALVAIHHGNFQGDAYAAFRDFPPVGAALWFAQLANMHALKVMTMQYQFSLGKKTKLLCDVLSSVPETLDPKLYLNLLPHPGAPAGSLARPLDWVESKDLWHGTDEIPVGTLDTLEITEGLLSQMNIPILSENGFSGWYCDRVEQLAQLGPMEYAIELASCGIEKVPSDRLQDLHCSAIEYRSMPLTSLSAFEEYASASVEDKFMTLVGTSDVVDLKAALQSCGKVLLANRDIGQESAAKLIGEAAVAKCSSDPHWACAILTAATTPGILQYGVDPTLYREWVSDVIDHCESAEIWGPLDDLVAHLIESLNHSISNDSSISKASSAESMMQKLYGTANRSQTGKIMSRLGIQMSINDLKSVEGLSEGKVVLRRAVTKAAGSLSSSSQWSCLWQDLCELQELNFHSVSKEMILEEICRALLHCGSFGLAESFFAGMDGVSLSPESAEKLVLAAARDLFYSSKSPSSVTVDQAKRCLGIVKHSSAIQQELDTIAAVKQLPSLGVEVAPSQLRSMVNKMDIIEVVLERHPDPARNIQRIVHLAESLGLDSPEEHQQVELLVAQSALQNGNLSECHKVLGKLIDENFAPAWELAHLLACAKSHTEHVSGDREVLMSFAIANCPEDKLLTLLESFKALELKEDGHEVRNAEYIVRKIVDLLRNPMVWVEDVEFVLARLSMLDPAKELMAVIEQVIESQNTAEARERVLLLLLCFCSSVESDTTAVGSGFENKIFTVPHKIYEQIQSKRGPPGGSPWSEMVPALHKKLMSNADAKWISQAVPSLQTQADLFAADGSPSQESFESLVQHMAKLRHVSILKDFWECVRTLSETYAADLPSLERRFIECVFLEEEISPSKLRDELLSVVLPGLSSSGGAISFLWCRIYGHIDGRDLARLTSFFTAASSVMEISAFETHPELPEKLDVEFARKWSEICEAFRSFQSPVNLKFLVGLDLGVQSVEPAALMAFFTSFETDDEIIKATNFMDRMRFAEEDNASGGMMNKNGVQMFSLLQHFQSFYRSECLPDFLVVLKTYIPHLNLKSVEDAVGYMCFGQILASRDFFSQVGLSLPAEPVMLTGPAKKKIIGTALASLDDRYDGAAKGDSFNSFRELAESSLSFLIVVENIQRLGILLEPVVDALYGALSISEDVYSVMRDQLLMGGDVRPLHLVGVRLKGIPHAPRDSKWKLVTNASDLVMTLLDRLLDDLRECSDERTLSELSETLESIMKSAGCTTPMPPEEADELSIFVDGLRLQMWSALQDFHSEEAPTMQETRLAVLQTQDMLVKGGWVGWSAPAKQELSRSALLLSQSLSVLGREISTDLSESDLDTLEAAEAALAGILKYCDSEASFSKVVQLLGIWEGHWISDEVSDDSTDASDDGWGLDEEWKAVSALHRCWLGLFERMFRCGRSISAMEIIDSQIANGVLLMESEECEKLVAVAKEIDSSGALAFEVATLLSLEKDALEALDSFLRSDPDAIGADDQVLLELLLNTDFFPRVLHSAHWPSIKAKLTCADPESLRGTSSKGGNALLMRAVALLSADGYHYYAGLLLLEASGCPRTLCTAERALSVLEVHLLSELEDTPHSKVGGDQQGHLIGVYGQIVATLPFSQRSALDRLLADLGR